MYRTAPFRFNEWLSYLDEKIRYTQSEMGEFAGYREVEHTADWELFVWGPDLPGLMRQAAKGIYELSQTKLADGPKIIRDFILSFPDRESLLVDFLSELLFYGEDEKLGFHSYDMRFENTSCVISAIGAPIMEQGKEIKAVTYHNMLIRDMENGLEVNIVFDV